MAIMEPTSTLYRYRVLYCMSTLYSIIQYKLVMRNLCCLFFGGSDHARTRELKDHTLRLAARQRTLSC